MCGGENRHVAGGIQTNGVSSSSLVRVVTMGTSSFPCQRQEALNVMAAARTAAEGDAVSRAAEAEAALSSLLRNHDELAVQHEQLQTEVKAKAADADALRIGMTQEIEKRKEAELRGTTQNVTDKVVVYVLPTLPTTALLIVVALLPIFSAAKHLRVVKNELG